MTSEQLFVYLCVNWNEENVCVEPDADDDDFAVGTGAQFTAQRWAEQGQTSKIIQFNKVKLPYPS